MWRATVSAYATFILLQSRFQACDGFKSLSLKIVWTWDKKFFSLSQTSHCLELQKF